MHLCFQKSAFLMAQHIYISGPLMPTHRRNQEIEMYTHTSGVDHEQGSLSLIGGGFGGPPPRKN